MIHTEKKKASMNIFKERKLSGHWTLKQGKLCSLSRMHLRKLAQQYSITASRTRGGWSNLRHYSPCESLGTLDPSSLAEQVISFQHVLRPIDQPHLTRATKAQDAICDQPLNSYLCLQSSLFEIISFISKRQVKF